MDTTTPELAILWQYEKRLQQGPKPAIPLGRRGVLRGEKVACVGFMRRSTMVEGERFGWSEYLLFNPFIGYRWLVEDEGQWSLVREAMALPTTPEGDLIAGQPPRGNIRHENRTYKFFQSSTGQVDFALGEFYWSITAGQQTHNTDYILPPYILSAEASADEITWSAGEHLSADEVYRAFDLETAPPVALGVGANQPNPVGRIQSLWVLYFMFCALGALMTMVFAMTSKSTLVFRHTYPYYANQKERAFVTDFFDVPGSHAADLDVSIQSAINNRWASYHVSLINDQNNTALDFGIDTEYWNGVDDGEAWSEGNPIGDVVLPHVEPGRYYLRIDPESGTSGNAEPFKADQPQPGNKLFDFTVEARSDVTLWSLFWYSTLLLLPFPIIQSIRSWAFESRRWANSG
jgi:hypothetical protein